MPLSAKKKARITAMGGRVTTVEEWLDLTPEEVAVIDMKIRLEKSARRVADRRDCPRSGSPRSSIPAKEGCRSSRRGRRHWISSLGHCSRWVAPRKRWRGPLRAETHTLTSRERGSRHCHSTREGDSRLPDSPGQPHEHWPAPLPFSSPHPARQRARPRG